MKPTSNFAKILTIAGVAAFLFCSTASADELLYIPETSGPGVNNPNGFTNLAYSTNENGESGAMYGGAFTNNTDSIWQVDSFVVWVVDNEQITGAGAGTAPTAYPVAPTFGNFSSLTLLGGNVVIAGSSVVSSSIAQISSGGLGAGYTIAAAPYASSLDGSTNYLSSMSPDTYDGVWQVTFNVTGLFIGSGETFAYSVADSPTQKNNDNTDLALNGTACGYGGNPACQTNGLSLINGTVETIYANDDVNVELFGSAVPEPTTWMLFGAGMSILALVRRRRS
jgi:hypothetical protein